MTIYLKQTHYPHLDGLRGIAIILVLLIHLYSIPLGWIGVDLFFVLSGFLITNILINYNPTFNSYKIFLIRRGLRIFPLYFLSLAIIFVVGKEIFIRNIENFDVLIKHQIYFWTYTQNFFLASDISRPIVLNHFWSLAIEEQFYIIWPILVLTTKKNLSLLLSISAGLILISVGLKLNSDNIAMNYSLLPFRMDSLILGAVVSILIKSNIKIKFSLALFIFFSALVIFMIIVGIENSFLHTTRWMSKIGYFTIDTLFASLILLSLILNNVGEKIRKLLDNKILIQFGKISYGLYIIHWPLKHIIVNSGMLNFLHSSVLINTIILFISIIASYITYHFYEIIFLNLKRKFEA